MGTQITAESQLDRRNTHLINMLQDITEPHEFSRASPPDIASGETHRAMWVAGKSLPSELLIHTTPANGLEIARRVDQALRGAAAMVQRIAAPFDAFGEGNEQEFPGGSACFQEETPGAASYPTAILFYS
jgi:hypothetical protein